MFEIILMMIGIIAYIAITVRMANRTDYRKEEDENYTED